MLGLMLEQASIDYLILERSSEIRPLGSAISLNGTVLRVFEQLGYETCSMVECLGFDFWLGSASWQMRTKGSFHRPPWF